MKKNVLGIIHELSPTGPDTYYDEALKFYDEVIFIDPGKVNYTFGKGQLPQIEYEGRVLNDLSMLYLFSHRKGTRRQVILLVRALMLCGCPISDNFERYLRDDIGKGYETLKKVNTEGDIPSYMVCSYSSARSLFDKLGPGIFPIVSKPIFGAIGRGITKFDNKEQVLQYLEKYFAKNLNFMMFEAFITFVKEWRAYIVDGQIIHTYERVREGKKITANLHQGGEAKKTSPEYENKLKTFLLKNLGTEYREGIYGVDVGLSDKGTLYIIETNRRPGWRGVNMTSDINFPYEVNRILFKRARKFR